MYRLLVTAIAIAAFLAIAPNGAFAQRGGADDIWKPHYSGTPRTTYSRSYNYARPYVGPTQTYQPSQGYQSFSFEPMGISAGETVAVTGNDVKIMLGNQVLGTAPQGLEFNVAQVRSGWLGAVVNIGGKEYRGWIFNRNVRPVE